jgi:transcriptional regulator with XRE-family HTH domain
MYVQRLRRNIRRVIDASGIKTTANLVPLKSISARHLYNVEHGVASITVDKLEEIADEIGADFLDFFAD